MQVLTEKELTLGGFAGLTEKRFVTDRRVFKQAKSKAFDGIGNFIYLADANFQPYGETHMHGHREVDVISVMMDGNIKHQGSLGHGGDLTAGDVQVQRAGGEGFEHNEVNPDGAPNRMLQLWVAPDELGEPAGYKVYSPEPGKVTKIYGGSKRQDEHFYSRTEIVVAKLNQGQSHEHVGEVLAYVASGNVEINGQQFQEKTLIREAEKLSISAQSNANVILVYVS